MGKREDEKKKRDQREYHRRMRSMNPAHRMAHKLAAPFERIEKYLEEVQGDEDVEPWIESEEIVEALEDAVVAVGRAAKVLQAKPPGYVPRVPKPKVKLKADVGSTVAVVAKFREDYSVVFTDAEMNALLVVSVTAGGRIFVQPKGAFEESDKPIPMRRSEVRLVDGGVPA